MIHPVSTRGGIGVEEDVVWNQPPGTPAVGEAFLRLYEFTKDPRWIAAAGAAARNMIDGAAAFRRLVQLHRKGDGLLRKNGAIGPRLSLGRKGSSFSEKGKLALLTAIRRWIAASSS